MKAPVISVLNMKGGVGKTTVSANVFHTMAYSKKLKVLVLDLDPQFNLTQSILTPSEYKSKVKKNKSIAACFEARPSKDFFSVKRTSDNPPSAKSLAVKYSLSAVINRAQVHLIAGSFDMVKFSIVDDRAQLKFASLYFEKFIDKERENYDLIVIDCNPSSSFLTMCALRNSTHIVSPVTPTRYSLQGIRLLAKLMKRQEINCKQAILINGVTRYTTPNGPEKSLRAHIKFGPNVLYHRLHRSTYLRADDGHIGFGMNRKRFAHYWAFRTNLLNVSNEIYDWMKS